MQKGVYYTPNHEYFAFDIFVVAGDHAYWVDVQDIPKFLGECIPTVPIFAKGTFEEMLNINIKINSIIPELLGLPRIEDNIIEGMVLRPNANRSASDKSRIILKKKNA